jgi:hypothetical protein
VSKPDGFVDIGPIIDHEWQRLGGRQNSELTDTDFDLAGQKIRILGAGRSRPHLSLHLNAVLHFEVGHYRMLGRVSHDLNQSGGVSQIEKSDSTVVTPTLHPSSNGHLFTDIRFGDGPRTM